MTKPNKKIHNSTPCSLVSSVVVVAQVDVAHLPAEVHFQSSLGLAGSCV